MRKYHIPVMLSACMEGLDIRENGIYLDVTFGGGGHAREILKRLGNGRLFAFDQDTDAEKNAREIADERLVFIQANFKHVSRYLSTYGVSKVDGLLADLGVSSHQIDQADRGFSTRFDGRLDMRMDRDSPDSAWEVINEYSVESLIRVFREYGEIRNAPKLAQAILRERIGRPIESTGQLVSIIEGMAPAGKRNQYLAQVFQAIRIEVNGEIEALKSLLRQAEELIRRDGRLVVLSYHSLEDRLVKHFIQKGDFSGTVEKDLYGNDIRPFEPVHRKPLTASAEEIGENPRARSARLRIGKKI